MVEVNVTERSQIVALCVGFTLLGAGLAYISVFSTTSGRAIATVGLLFGVLMIWVGRSTLAWVLRGIGNKASGEELEV